MGPIELNFQYKFKFKCIQFHCFHCKYFQFYFYWYCNYPNWYFRAQWFFWSLASTLHSFRLKRISIMIVTWVVGDYIPTVPSELVSARSAESIPFIPIFRNFIGLQKQRSFTVTEGIIPSPDSIALYLFKLSIYSNLF